MSIERVETICREFLLHSETPLVSVSQLYQHCIAEEAVRDALTEEVLLNFLREHADVVVVEGVEEDAPVARNEFDQAGLAMGPRAILKSRMPTRDEMKNMFQMQLEVMRDTLMQALKHAKESQDTSRIAEIEQALENTDSIGERLGDL